MVFKTRLWMPGTDYLNLIAERVRGRIRDGDLLVVSEKPLSTALGYVFDEAHANPGLLARGIAGFWTRIIWGRILGPFTGMRDESLERLRSYPTMEGARHKELALRLKGLMAALKPWSEGGLDASNLPYSYCAAPPPDPRRIAYGIRDFLRQKLGVDAAVAVIDSDKTYLLRNIGLSSRDSEVPGIVNLGFLSFLLGRKLRLRAYATPVAYVGGPIPLRGLLRVASAADRAMGSGAGDTVWDMAETFNTDLTGVSWEMLAGIPHRPIAIVRGVFKA
ncbi:MAG: coenzyme F420-0:L-glutamate ligase [Candidatus Bathyarchaeia archaeon]